MTCRKVTWEKVTVEKEDKTMGEESGLCDKRKGE